MALEIVLVHLNFNSLVKLSKTDLVRVQGAKGVC